MNAVQTTARMVTPAVQDWSNPDALVERVNKMHEIQRRVMRKDVHYGVIPGCKQNSLYQPGSQILSMAFKIAHEPSVQDLGNLDEVKYRITDRVFDIATGETMGYGVGECSSNEEKYAWRRAGSDEEWEETALDRRRVKHGRDSVTKQVRTNIADVANTVLKMSLKRANVCGTINALAASDLFTQDIEDLPDGMELGDRQAAQNGRPTNMTPPTRKSAAAGSDEEPLNKPDDDERKKNRWISTKQEGRLYGICKTADVEHRAVRAWLREIHKKPDFELYMVTWAKAQGKTMSEYDGVCEKVEKEPNFFAKYTAAAEVATQASTPAPAGAPSDTEEFELYVVGMLDVLEIAPENREKELGPLLAPFKVKTAAELSFEDRAVLMGELTRRVKARETK